MARGRRNLKREAAQARQVESIARTEREQQEADAQAALDRRRERKWGNARSGLDRLSALSRDLEKLHRDEATLLRERDELVTWLRDQGQSWVALSSRTKLSRQALMKRAAIRGSTRV